MSKIKVNELETATPTLNDTLLGSNATKEYACKVEDLKTLIGGGSNEFKPLIIEIVESETPPEGAILPEPNQGVYCGYYIKDLDLGDILEHYSRFGAFAPQKKFEVTIEREGNVISFTDYVEVFWENLESTPIIYVGENQDIPLIFIYMDEDIKVSGYNAAFYAPLNGETRPVYCLDIGG